MAIIRKILKKILTSPTRWVADHFASNPIKHDVFASLTDLLARIEQKQTDGEILDVDYNSARFIIFSDQHKGAGDLADDFRLARRNYSAALDYYFHENYSMVNLGDCEELWENTEKVAVEFNRDVLLQEARFLQANRYYRVFGNHDLQWKFSFPRNLFLKPLFGDKLSVCEGVLLRFIYNNRTFRFLLTHGHQGDKRSDGNWFSTWFVAAIWTPIQRYLEISVNTISDSYELVDKHNQIMYQWSETCKDLVLICGHTHKPVFASMDHIDRLKKFLAHAQEKGDKAEVAKTQEELSKREAEYIGKQYTKTMAVPSYFNTGCCCFNDGDITGIEIADGEIRLVKWELENDQSKPERKILEWAGLDYIFDELSPIQTI
jgi:predicted phosphodiesterase